MFKSRLLFLFILLTFPACHFYAQNAQVWMHPNEGQWDQRINYKVDLSGGSMLIENQGFTFVFHNAHEVFHGHPKEMEGIHEELNFHAIKFQFKGSNAQALKRSANLSSFYRNYILNNDPSNWRSKVYSVEEVVYEGFYPGVNLKLNGDLDAFKYAFEVAPGHDPSVIKMDIEGSDRFSIDDQGKLLVSHTFGQITDAAPKAWTIGANGRKKEVKINYLLKGSELSYEFPSGYDQTQTLIIDPSLTFSSYTGSSADNWGNTATGDKQYNLVGGGIVFDAGYPVTSGAFDASYNGGITGSYGIDMGITKYSPDGTAFLYSTYLGGSAGNETPLSLFSDDAGNVYILGTTASSNFPMAGTPFQPGLAGGSFISTAANLDYSGTDIVIAHLSADGTSLLHATFLGGSGNDGLNDGDLSSGGDLVHNYGDNFRGEIILDNAGNVLIASTTTSSNFPTRFSNQAFGGTQDAVFAKLSGDLSTLIWSTYYGASGHEAGYSIQTDPNGDFYATGGTNSNGLSVPGGQLTTYQGGTDGFLIRLANSNGALLNGTYVGTSSYDQSFFVQTDNNGDVYVYGQTEGNMIMSAGLFGNASATQFVRKYTPDLSTISWTTRVGGNSSSTALSPTAFLVSDCREIYLAGWGGSILGSDISNFPTTSDAFMPSSVDGDAFWIAVLDKDASALKYSTFIGGSSDDHVDGGTSRFDKTGRIYHAVCSSCGLTNNGFVSTSGVIASQDNTSGYDCNMAVFKFELNTIKSIIAIPNYVICAPDNVIFTNNSVEGDTYYWEFGDGASSTLKDPSHFYGSPGQYNVKLVVSDSQGCKTPDSTEFILDIGSFAPGTVNQPPTICPGTPYQFQAQGGAYYIWSPANVLDNPTISNPTATVYQSTNFSVIIGDSCGYDTVFVQLPVFNDQITISNDTAICIGNSVQLHMSGAINPVWSPNMFIDNFNSPDPIVNPPSTTTYVVDATSVNGCALQDSVRVNVFFTLPGGIIEDTATACLGDPVEVHAIGAYNYIWSPPTDINSFTDSTVLITPPSSMYYYCELSNPCGVSSDSVFINVLTLQIRAGQDQVLCIGDSAFLTASGALTYLWSPPTYLDVTEGELVKTIPQESIVYQVLGTDVNGCQDTALVHISLYPNTAVSAGVDQVAKLGDNVLLNAVTNGQGSFVWTPDLYLSCTTCQSTYAAPNYDMEYMVTFTDQNGCVSSDYVKILYGGVIYVPNTFTPDENKHNEVFKVYGSGIEHVEVWIFDRWGELVAKLNSMDESWDGTYKGQKCQDGTYTWKLKYVDQIGSGKTLTGHVNLLR